MGQRDRTTQDTNLTPELVTKGKSLWGWKPVKKMQSSGVFLCPAESTERAYWVYQVRRWLTVLSVPVMAGGVLRTHVECFCCEAKFDIDVINPGPIHSLPPN